MDRFFSGISSITSGVVSAARSFPFPHRFSPQVGNRDSTAPREGPARKRT